MRTVTSREVYANPWMTLREDVTSMPDGSPGVYAVVDKPDYALIIPFDGRRVCLVEQFRYPLGLRRWEFPQGTAPEPMSPSELAARELREETGLRAGRLVELGVIDVASGLSSQRGRAFLATDLIQGEHDREPGEQDMITAWFDRTELDDLIAKGVITDAQSLAAYTLWLVKAPVMA